MGDAIRTVDEGGRGEIQSNTRFLAQKSREMGQKLGPGNQVMGLKRGLVVDE